MERIRLTVRQGTEFFSRYPAVLSGYIIYGYLFLSIMRLFLKVKHGTASVSDAYDIFSALPFMWLLAVAMVKVIEVRTKLHESQTQLILDRERLRVRETQLHTMKEVVRGLQHRVNNPLAIILLYVSRIRRKSGDNAETLNGIEQIDIATKNISSALAEFSAAQRYETEHAGPLVGDIAVPPKN